MYESKFLKKKKTENKLLKYINKILLLISFVLIGFISCKSNPNIKNFVKKEIFEKNLSFAKINKWYKDTFGSLIPIEDIIPIKEEVSVFSDTLEYDSDIKYEEGAKLTVSNNYLIPVINSGIVVFIGEKEKYGKTIIVQQVDGVDCWYGNINTESVKLYDYVEKGMLLGEVNKDFLYLAFQKEGDFLDYKKYI